jgi:hypothetical protein
VALTANLQMSLAQIARAAGISTRLLHMAAQLMRTGRDDLVAEVKAGRMTVHRALVLAGAIRTPRRDGGLIAAWQRATPEEQRTFADWLLADNRDAE